MARGTFAPGAHGRTSGGLDRGARPRWVRRRYREGARETRGRCLARLRDVGSTWGCRDRALRLAVPEWRVETDGSGAEAFENDRGRPECRLARPPGYGAQERRAPGLSDGVLNQRHGRPPRWRTLLPLRAACQQERLRGSRSR